MHPHIPRPGRKATRTCTDTAGVARTVHGEFMWPFTARVNEKTAPIRRRRVGIRKTSRAAEMPSMTTALEQRAASRVAPIGLLFLVTASVGWGLNWPVMKFVFSEWPPLSARGWAGVIGAAALALYAVATGVSLKVPADQWSRLIISAILNVALWVAVMSYALLWLPASEAVVIAYTMPVWTALLAWPLLGERLTLLRVTALVMAFAGLASLFGAG